MASELKNLSTYNENNIPNGKDFHISIVVAEWNTDITHNMHQQCVETLIKHGVNSTNIHVHQVPGTYEIPLACKWALNKDRSHAVIGLGCVIRGATKHDDYINHATAQALQSLSLSTGLPCIFGVVTTNDLQQAIDRSGGAHGNKGVEAAVTALRMISLNKKMKESDSEIGFR